MSDYDNWIRNRSLRIEDLFQVKIIFHGKEKCFPKMIEETSAYEEWISFITLLLTLK